MQPNFLETDRNTLYLLPPSVQDWLPKGHLARFVVDIINQVNLTDKESRIMPTSGGGFEQAYNTQAAVDTKSKLIVAAHITQQSNDKQEIAPTLDNKCNLPKEIGTPTGMLADSGYYSENNIAACEDKAITPFIAVGCIYCIQQTN